MILLTLVAAGSGCGGSVLTEPEEIPIRVYSAGGEFRLTVVMTSCSSTCADYEAAECSADVDLSENRISIDASVCFKRVEDMCSDVCGPPILAHCRIPSLPAGTYTVESGDFRDVITVR